MPLINFLVNISLANYMLTNIYYSISKDINPQKLLQPHLQITNTFNLNIVRVVRKRLQYPVPDIPQAKREQEIWSLKIADIAITHNSEIIIG